MACGGQGNPRRTELREDVGQPILIDDIEREVGSLDAERQVRSVRAGTAPHDTDHDLDLPSENFGYRRKRHEVSVRVVDQLDRFEDDRDLDRVQSYDSGKLDSSIELVRLEVFHVSFDGGKGDGKIKQSGTRWNISVVRQDMDDSRVTGAVGNGVREEKCKENDRRNGDQKRARQLGSRRLTVRDTSHQELREES